MTETRSHRILIVADFPDAAETACVLFALMGHECRVAFKGFEALSVALAFLFCGGAIFVLAGTTAASTAYLFLFLLGASDGTTEVVYDTLLQARFPRGMLAGAFAAAAAIQRLGMIVGFLLAPVLLAFGWMAALEVSGAVCLVGGCLAGGVISVLFHLCH